MKTRIIFTFFNLISLALMSQTSYRGSSLSTTTNATNTTASDLTITSGTISTGITTGTQFPNEPYYEATSGWTATSQAAAKEICFTITPDPGYSISITNFSYAALATSAGPSVTSFTIGDSIYSGSNLNGSSLSTINQGISNQNNITVATAVCIQGWDNGTRSTTGGGDFRFDSIVLTLSSVLPIKLKAPISASQKGNDVDITWTTSSEQNNSHFNIEHSLNGFDFGVVGTIKGSGETDFDKSYAFLHKNAPLGVNYYRLTQVDFDGKSETFETLSIEVADENKFLIYPTVTSDFIEIKGANDVIEIYDLSGSSMHNRSKDKRIDVSNYPKGIYILKTGDLVGRFLKI